MKTLKRYFIEQLFNELLFLQASIIVQHEMKLSLQMLKNLATIDIFQNIFGQRDGFKNLLEKNKENMNIKEQNQTTVELNKFNRK